MRSAAEMPAPTDLVATPGGRRVAALFWWCRDVTKVGLLLGLARTHQLTLCMTQLEDEPPSTVQQAWIDGGQVLDVWRPIAPSERVSLGGTWDSATGPVAVWLALHDTIGHGDQKLMWRRRLEHGDEKLWSPEAPEGVLP